jgi:hypothetical protein
VSNYDAATVTAVRELIKDRIAKELSSLSDAELDEWVTDALEAHDEDGSFLDGVSGRTYLRIMAYYSAHLIYASGADQGSGGDGGAGAGVVGPIASRKSGDASESYSNPAPSSSASEAWLRTTRYGNAYLAQLRSHGAGLPYALSL